MVKYFCLGAFAHAHQHVMMQAKTGQNGNNLQTVPPSLCTKTLFGQQLRYLSFAIVMTLQLMISVSSSRGLEDF